MTPNEIIRFFAEQKEKQDQTYQQLADKAGYHRTTVQRWLHDGKPITLDETADLAHVLGYELTIRPIPAPLDGWLVTLGADIKPGKYRVKGWTLQQKEYEGVAVLYPDGHWYTLNGHKMPAPDYYKPYRMQARTAYYD